MSEPTKAEMLAGRDLIAERTEECRYTICKEPNANCDCAIRAVTIYEAMSASLTADNARLVAALRELEAACGSRHVLPPHEWEQIVDHAAEHVRALLAEIGGEG